MNHSEYMKQWRIEHPGYYKQYKKDYYQNNKTEIDERTKNWASRHLERKREITRNGMRKLRAKKRGMLEAFL